MSMLPFGRGTNPLSAFESTQGYIVAEQNASMFEEMNHLAYEVKELQEDMLKISDAFDGIGWAQMSGTETAELPLKTVKKASEIARELALLNPHIKSGVAARIGYIWGKGVTFDGVDTLKAKMRENRRKLFSPQAFEEFERALATDGNVFVALPANDTDTVFRVPLDEIMGVVSNPKDTEDIWMYKREYVEETVNGQTGAANTVTVIKYYLSLTYYNKLQRESKSMPKRFGKVGVEQGFIIQHTAVNRQIGWRWGVPDIMPVIFWAKAYKEYLEDNATLVKAYSRLAFSINGNNAAGLQSAAAQVMAPPTRDPMTGEARSVGGTALMGAGTQLTPVAATGSSVDFTKGSPLAAAIAAGLEVPLVVITRDASGANRSGTESLDLPTLKAMETRQQVHTERFLELFEYWGVSIDGDTSTELQEAVNDSKTPENEGVDHAVVTWPQIETDSTKDRIAAVITSVEGGVLFKEEARKEALDVLGIAPFKPWNELPTPEDDPMKQYEAEQAQLSFDREQQAASVIAKQGVSGGVAAAGGAQNTNNSARDNRAKDTKNS